MHTHIHTLMYGYVYAYVCKYTCKLVLLESCNVWLQKNYDT